MLRPVMQQVAPLAERSDVAVLAAAVGRDLVEMAGAGGLTAAVT